LSLDQKNPEGFSYFVESLKRTREKLESFTGNKITDEKLQQAISLYNRIRGLLNKISLMRQPEHLPISTLDFIKLNHASYLADPKVMVEALDSICHELEQQKKKPSSGKPKLLLIAPNIALGDYKILRVIEEAGGEICCEEICEGVRTYSVNVGTNGRDPLEALAIKYIKNREVPCAFMTDSIRPRFDYAVKLAKKFQVDGVIWYQLKMCETYDIESVFFAKHLREHNLPMLKLESEYDLSDKQQLSTRIEAFLETLERRVS
jgi:benzoyl-CoA reductase/2-hydroxyglutaryl-CoA dehydratase subunit BcrC/BadD/HgdB